MDAAPAVPRRSQAEPLRGPLRWIVRAIAVLAICATFSVIVINTIRGWPNGYWPLLVMVSNASVGTAYIVVGWLLTERRPRNAVGPLLLAFGVLWAFAAPGDLYLSQVIDGVPLEELPLARYAALYALAIGFPLAVLSALALVLFPNGRPLSWRWLLVALVLCGLVLLGVAAYAFGSGTFGPQYPSVDSPFRMPGFPRRTLIQVTDVASQALSLLTVAALAVRWYRGTRVERAQVKWVAVAVAAIAVMSFVAEQLDDGPWDWPAVITALVLSTSGILLPLAIGVAILRYRLYDLDRIVSRTAAYAAVTAILFAVYAVVNFTALAVVSTLAGGGGSTLSTAVATLAAAALFNPLRTRAQRIVDRRFHRARYDAQRVVDGFGERLRDEPDLPRLVDELHGTVAVAVEPSATAVWVRSR